MAAAGSSQYRFVTVWTLQAPIEAVWAELSRPEAWPDWWRGVRRVELVEPGDAAGVGALRRVTMTSALPYRLTFAVRTVRLDRPHVIEVQSDGDVHDVLMRRGLAGLQRRLASGASSPR